MIEVDFLDCPSLGFKALFLSSVQLQPIQQIELLNFILLPCQKLLISFNWQAIVLCGSRGNQLQWGRKCCVLGGRGWLCGSWFWRSGQVLQSRTSEQLRALLELLVAAGLTEVIGTLLIPLFATFTGCIKIPELKWS